MIEKFIADWCKKNPYMIYGDRNDQLSEKQISYLLEGKFEAFDEDWYEIEMHARDFISHDHMHEMIEAVKAEFDDLIWDEEETLKLESIYWEHMTVDSSDLLNTAFAHTRVQATALVLWDDGEVVEFPHWELDEEENERRVSLLKDWVKDPDKAEPTYCSEVLKICGTVDLKEIYTRQKVPNRIKITPADSRFAVLHGSWNGSGNLGSIDFTKEVTMKCVLQNDKGSKYGVDAVYGFTGRFWRENELALVWENDHDDNEQKEARSGT